LTFYYKEEGLILDENGNVKPNMKITESDKNELPINKFKRDYNEFRNNINKNITLMWRFFSTARIYYNEDKIADAINEAMNGANICVNSIQKFVHSKNTEEINENFKEFLTSFENFADANNELSRRLASQNIKLRANNGLIQRIVKKIEKLKKHNKDKPKSEIT
jgi:diketogulonate reductase-like aldo/keto reductase